MIETAGDALTAGWRVHVRCLSGVVEYTRSHANCRYQAELSMFSASTVEVNAMGGGIRMAGQGRRRGTAPLRLKSCPLSQSLRFETLAWTRGRNMPLSALRERMMCPCCGNRRVNLIFDPPTNTARAPMQ
jgi:hypothetical protein